MKLEKSLKLALNIILHSKLRSWLTIIGIVIGVASIIAIISIGSGFEKDIQKQLGGLGSDTITITAGFERASGENCPGPKCREGPGVTQQATSAEPLSNKEVQAIKLIPEIEFISPTISGKEEVYYLGEDVSLNIEGVDSNVWKFITISDVEKGRLLGPGDTNAIVIGRSISKDIFKNEIGINRQIQINGKSFSVVGILKESGGFGQDDKKIFMPIQSAREVLDKKTNVYDSITVKVRNQNDVDKVEKSLEKKIMVVRHVDENTKDFTVLSMKSIQERVSAILGGFTLFLAVIAAVSLIVGAVGIANTMFTAVLERTKEIGIMKSLGAKNSDIMLIFLFNSGFVGLVGGIIGVIFGVLIALIIPKLGVSFVSGGSSLTTSISPQLIIFSLLFSIILGMISGAVPAYRASKLKPVDALRYE